MEAVQNEVIEPLVVTESQAEAAIEKAEEGLDLFGGDLSGPTNRDNRYISSIPSLEKGPLILKFLPVFVDGKKMQYISVVEFPHQTGPGASDRGRHACQKTFGGSESPEMDYYMKLKNAQKAQKDEGFAAKNSGDRKGEQAADVKVKKLQAEMDKFRPRFAGWVFGVEPGSDTIKAFKFGPMLLNRLNGRKETKWTPAVPSIQKELSAKGYSCFLHPKAASNETHWLKVYKTGEEIATRYFIEVDSETIANADGSETVRAKNHVLGKNMQAMLAGTFKVTSKDLPDPIKDVEERFNRFSPEQALKFVELKGNLNATPAEFLRQENRSDSGNVNSDPESGDAAVAPQETVAADTTSVDDLF